MGIDRALNRGYVAGVLVVIALLAINAAVAYRNTRQLNDDAYWVSHTQEALDALEEANSAMRGAEAAERGFLITGNPNYSKHYEEIANTILPKLDHLRDLTVDNSVQQAQILELQQEIQARLALLATDIAARKHEAENSRFVSVSEPGQAALETIRDHFAAMRAEEHRLLREREPATARAYRISVATNVLAALLGLALVGMLVYLLRRDLLARMKSAAAVEEQREWLHTTLASIGDAVIATDALGKVTFMNPIAESLTGWPQAEAVAHSLVDIFKIENEQTRKTVENPVARVLREGNIVGLANHTVLMARDGTERPIDDSAAPIKDVAGKMLGVVMVFRDVTERRRADEALRSSQTQLSAELAAMTRLHNLTTRLLNSTDLHTVLEAILDSAIALQDAQFGNIRLYNRENQSLEIMAQRGFNADFLEHFRAIRREDDSASGRAMRTGTRVVIEDVETDPQYSPDRQFAASAGYRAVQATPLVSRSGELLGMLSTHFAQPHSPSQRDLRMLDLYARKAADFVERLRAGEALRQSEEQFRRAILDAPIPILMHAEDGELLEVSKAWTRMSGYSKQEVGDYEGWLTRAYGGAAWRAGIQVRRAFERNVIPPEQEVAIRTRQGEVRIWLLTASAPGILRDGRKFLVEMATDVTERKREADVSKFLSEASATLSALVDTHSTLQKVAHMAVPFFADWCVVDLADEEGHLQRLAVAHHDPNQAIRAQELMEKYPPDPSATHGTTHVWRTGQSELVTDITEEMLAATAKGDEHLRLMRELGLKSYLTVPLRASGKMLGVLTFANSESGRNYTPADLLVAEDLAHRAAIAIENAHLYAAVREGDRRKDEFLAMLAHELRNPLAPIRNALAILQTRHADGAMLDRAREMMERQLHHLIRLVDDLLDVSRIMRGKIELRIERLDAREVVGRAVETAQPVLDAHGHDIDISLPDKPLWLNGDSVRLTQVVANLLNNAAKYTPTPGRIRLALEQAGDQALIRVKDSGIGIAPEALPRIFDLFVQADLSLARSQGGLGIGLTLVCRLVEMHGGTVSATSEGLGQGSEFIVRLPLAQAQAIGSPKTDGQPSHAADRPPRRVLVVDDNVDAAQTMAMLLRLLNHDVVHVVHDGPAALKAAQEFKPDVIFLDIGLPGISGYEVARQLRERAEFRDVLLVAVTGYGQSDDRQRSQQAGFDHHLVKPVAPEALQTVLLN
jgi:PAS domain S-box-containing protein